MSKTDGLYGLFGAFLTCCEPTTLCRVKPAGAGVDRSIGVLACRCRKEPRSILAGRPPFLPQPLERGAERGPDSAVNCMAWVATQLDIEPQQRRHNHGELVGGAHSTLGPLYPQNAHQVFFQR